MKTPEAPLASSDCTDRDKGAGTSASTRSREGVFSRREPGISATRSQRSSSGKSDSSTLWKGRTLGAETLRGLFPSMAALSTPVQNRETNRRQEDEKTPQTFILPWNRDLSALARNSQGSCPISRGDSGFDVKLAAPSGDSGQRSDDDIVDSTINENSTNTFQASRSVKFRFITLCKDRRFSLVDNKVGEPVISIHGNLQGLHDSIERDFELHDKEVRAKAWKSLEIGGPKRVVGLRRYNNTVLARGLINNNDGNSRLLVLTSSNRVNGNAKRAKTIKQEGAIWISANGTHHGDVGRRVGQVRIPRQFAACYSLVGTLAAGRSVEMG
ncbi:hypothetical protein HG531_003543 [Fusarium graminearum]|nr:hypothetical protein HG531_003543 [Fusarium graminearum]